MDQRYVSSFHTEQLKTLTYDVVILGTGIAGLYTALNIDRKYRVAILTKTILEKNNSNLAQGGIAACVDHESDFEAHYQDTLKAGAHYNNQEAVRILIDEAPENIHRLIQYGTKFDRDEEGKLNVTKEGGHSQRRVLHAKDETGREMIRALAHEIKGRDNIEVIENLFALDILTQGDGVVGILGMEQNGEKVVYECKTAVVATGGIGELYGSSTNPSIATGDGIAMAYRAGAVLTDMEFIQFHPTAMYRKGPGQKFLISEAVRGEGAILRNTAGEAFMERYHLLKDLAPRDIVARGIFSEMTKSHSEFVYLDITHKPEDFIRARFPMIYERCLEEGIDLTKDWIPVAPAEHYIMGGIKTDMDGKTAVKGLYACGECACTGVHGANRLASNSLLEGVVFGYRVARAINQRIEGIERSRALIENELGGVRLQGQALDEKRKRLKEIMDWHVSIVRREEGLRMATKEIEAIQKDLMTKEIDSVEYYELMNMTTVALCITRAAQERKKSLGGHFRADEMEG